MASILSSVPLVNRLVGSSAADQAIDIPPVDVHNVETTPDPRARTLKHLLRANHVNYAILSHDLQYHNHLPHILCSAYLLGAGREHLRNVYDHGSKDVEPWGDSPGEIGEDEWRDFLGNKPYQRAFLDFFEDRLMSRTYMYEWQKVVSDFMFRGKQPLVNSLIGGLGHPLIHLGYAYEMNSKDMAIEALAMTAVEYNFLHKYTDEASYTRPSPIASASPLDLLHRLAADRRFDGLFDKPSFDNVEPALLKHEALVLEYWNAWAVGDDPVKQFEQSQEAAVAVLVATVPPGTYSYNFFLAHVLTTSHAVRILLPNIPTRFHVSLVRQWWLLALTVYIALLRPKVDPDWVPKDLRGRRWAYVEEKAINSTWAQDAHFVKAIRAMRDAARTWGDVHDMYLIAALRFVDDFHGWTF